MKPWLISYYCNIVDIRKVINTSAWQDKSKYRFSSDRVCPFHFKPMLIIIMVIDVNFKFLLSVIALIYSRKTPTPGIIGTF